MCKIIGYITPASPIPSASADLLVGYFYHMTLLHIPATFYYYQYFCYDKSTVTDKLYDKLRRNSLYPGPRITILTMTYRYPYLLRVVDVASVSNLLN